MDTIKNTGNMGFGFPHKLGMGKHVPWRANSLQFFHASFAILHLEDGQTFHQLQRNSLAVCLNNMHPVTFYILKRQIYSNKDVH